LTFSSVGTDTVTVTAGGSFPNNGTGSSLINFNNGKHVFHNLITYMSDRIQHRERWVSALQTSSIPLALINGSVDPVSGSHMVARYRELDCRLDYCAELAKIGHYPQVEAPEDVLTHYQIFLHGDNL
ncbi:MAG: alpha/beta hydrolase, partial [Porticoccaceae bacterium]